MDTPALSRRHFGIVSLAALLQSQLIAADKAARGKVRHSACKWCYKDISLDDLCTAGKEFLCRLRERRPARSGRSIASRSSCISSSKFSSSGCTSASRDRRSERLLFLFMSDGHSSCCNWTGRSRADSR